jgi:predicted O-methyltransferase YrrM
MKYNNKFKFTETWFDIAIPGWEQVLIPSKLNIKNVLEVGCFEGRATVWICENILNDTSIEYNYDIVDTFGGSLNESGMGGTKERLEDDNFIENNFLHNISFFNNVNFQIHKGYSQNILPTFPQKEKYDLIYIDASHRADDTFVDAYYAHKMLKVGGIIIFDDYGWKDPTNMHQVNSPQLGIEVFGTMYDEQYDVILKGYQIGLQKIK